MWVEKRRRPGTDTSDMDYEAYSRLVDSFPILQLLEYQ